MVQATATLYAQGVRVNGRKARLEESLDMADGKSSLSGLSGNEAKEFHSLFITSFIGFTVIAIIAHALVWQWRPWF